jgi:ribosomal protein L29
MKYKEKQNYSKSTLQELTKEVESLESTLKKINIERYVKQIKNSREVRIIRQKIAIIKTYMTQKISK